MRDEGQLKVFAKFVSIRHTVALVLFIYQVASHPGDRKKSNDLKRSSIRCHVLKCIPRQ